MFDWDDNKLNKNFLERGFDFEYASLIFEKDTVERVDNRRDYREERIIALGEIDSIVYCVVYTWRQGVCRIVSARVANRKERNVYSQTISSGNPDTEGPG
jgi:uncharacterized DUF497 family protein